MARPKCDPAEYQILTERTSDGLWYWEAYYKEERIGKAGSDWAGTSYGWFRWSARNQAKAACRSHARRTCFEENPQSETKAYVVKKPIL